MNHVYAYIIRFLVPSGIALSMSINILMLNASDSKISGYIGEHPVYLQYKQHFCRYLRNIESYSENIGIGLSKMNEA